MRSRAARIATFPFRPGRLAPHAREPRLSFARQAGRAVIMGELEESRGGQVTAPAFEIVVDAVASAAPSFLVVAARVRSEQHAAGFQAGMQSAEDIGQRPARY